MSFVRNWNRQWKSRCSDCESNAKREICQIPFQIMVPKYEKFIIELPKA